MNQLKSLDLFKFIAALMVVAIHAYPIHSYYAVCSYRIAVPFFLYLQVSCFGENHLI